ncbi:hypothetical protein VKT23_015504 [Stygiomarasmius scandens]|uniref:Uncharacterized protein n=1 Tax=Marasmiellus scandens TaxID=2682957 RepID=A0ABR1IXZ2_9AGAR
MIHPGKSLLSTLSVPEWQTFGKDRLQAPLTNGGLVSLAVHITGENPVFEISYLSPEDHSNPTALTTLSTPGFVVPMTRFHDQSALFNVYAPLDASVPFERAQVDQLFFPITDNKHPVNSFRVLHYVPYRQHDTHDSYSALGNVFLAFGFHETKFWVDMAVFKADQAPTTLEVWNSYLDGGSRARARLDCQVSVSRPFPWLRPYYELMVTVETIQSGRWHGKYYINLNTKISEANDMKIKNPEDSPTLKREKSAYSLLKDDIWGA